MDRTVEMLIAYRKTTGKVLSGLSMVALNTIPPGFNNNLIWNFGHVVVSQQTLCYPNAGMESVIDDTVIAKFRKGTKPGKFIDKAEFESLKKISDAALIRLDEDLQKNLFVNISPFTVSSYGIEVRNVEDLLKLLLNHEGLHLGYCMALKRALSYHGNGSL
jgi:hypothetical protein